MRIGETVIDNPAVFVLGMVVCFMLASGWALTSVNRNQESVVTPKPNMVCQAHLLFTQNQQGELHQVIDQYGHGIACSQ